MGDSFTEDSTSFHNVHLTVNLWVRASQYFDLTLVIARLNSVSLKHGSDQLLADSVCITKGLVGVIVAWPPFVI